MVSHQRYINKEQHQGGALPSLWLCACEQWSSMGIERCMFAILSILLCRPGHWDLLWDFSTQLICLSSLVSFHFSKQTFSDLLNKKYCYKKLEKKGKTSSIRWSRFPRYSPNYARLCNVGLLLFVLKGSDSPTRHRARKLSTLCILPWLRHKIAILLLLVARIFMIDNIFYRSFYCQNGNK